MGEAPGGVAAGVSSIDIGLRAVGERPSTLCEVIEEGGREVDLVAGLLDLLDGGPCEIGVESTIVDVTGEIPSILRPGGVTREDLETVLGRPLAVPSMSRVRVPGQHPSHYAPRARVVLVEPVKVIAEAELAHELGHQVGVFLPPAFTDADAPVKAHAVVTVPGSVAAYARGLYGFLRELDQQGCDLIVASLPMEEGLGLAIANRLRRAAGPRPSE
ncbi:Threonylcarbamoyl-AMP synthase [Streptomyces sp. RB17]|nr:Threonylcarbamoyl-AMP synthase [Streptomyces sp. RB17]